MIHKLSQHPKLIALSLISLLLPLAGLSLITSLFFQDLSLLKNPGNAWIPSYILIAGCLAGIGMIPTHFLSLLAGYVFGLSAGTTASILAIALGSWIGISLSTKITGGSLNKILDSHPLSAKIQSSIIRGGPFNTFAGILLARLPPQVPFALGNVIAGSMQLNPWIFIAATLLGMLPRAALAVWVGAELASWNLESSPPAGLWLSVLCAAIGFGGLFLWSYLIARSNTPPNPLLNAADPIKTR